MYSRKIIPIISGLIARRDFSSLSIRRSVAAINSYIPSQSHRQTTVPKTTITTAEPVPIIQIRCYAKSKDKKKDKGKKSGAKIEINEAQLREIIDLDTVNDHMQKSVQHMKEDFIKHLSLRSTSGAIETLRVTVDGGEHELQELAQISRKNPKTIVINMIGFPQTIPDVMSAIEKSGMNLNPQQDGTTIFIPIPKVTKEHRENLSKNAKTLFIKHRDSIRDIQNNTIKKLKKQTDISKDDMFAVQAQVTAIADGYIEEAEKILAAKQKELLGDA